MTTHVLVTGGAGYLGSVLVQSLLVQGYRVTVLDNFMHRQPSLSHLCAFDKLQIIRGDAKKIAYRPVLLEAADVIVPLAAIVGAPACALDYNATWETNCRAVTALCNNAPDEKVIIYPNTNSGYGRGGELLCIEESPLEPVSEYGRSKVKAEEQVLKKPFGIALRFATLFGASPRMRLDLMVNDFVYRAVRDGHIAVYEGHHRRNFLHVRDAVGAILHAIKNHSSMGGKAFNAGHSDANMTKLQLAQKIALRTGCSVSEISGKADPDQRDYVVSNARLERTGWRPEYSIDDGIEELVRCFVQTFESHRNA